MSAEKFLVTAAAGETGRYTVQRLLEKGHTVRALVHKEDERSETIVVPGAGHTHAETVVDGVWEPNRKAIETVRGEVIEERRNPRASFDGHTRATPQDDQHDQER